MSAARGWAAAAIFGAFVAASAYWWLTWPEVSALARRDPETTAFIERYRERRRAAGESEEVAWRPVPYERISVHLKRAVVAAEDLEFFSHRGFSSSEMKAAITKALREMEAPRGASTITQQLAKNLWLSPSRNPLRKLKEAVLTRQLERHLSKRRILELYLNVVEFGRGVYGAEAAAQVYFGKSADALTEEEAAQLAASLPRPSSWHPGATSRSYARYVSEIRRRMDAARFLWRAVGGGTGPPADTIPVALPDLDSLLRAVQDSLRIPDTPLVDPGAGQIADTPETRRDTPLVRTDSTR